MACSFNFVDEFKQLDSHIKKEVYSKLSPMTFRKNEYILREGDVCEGIYIILSGGCRVFTNAKYNKDITTAFKFENEYVCSLLSMVQKQPTNENIQATEDMSCVFLPVEVIYECSSKYPEFGIFIRKSYEILLMKETELLNSLRSLSAYERYELFMKEHPKIIQRVQLGHLASYLNMSQETLSRMRNIL